MPVTNSVTLIGRLGADLKLKTFDNGGVVGNVSIATNERSRNPETGEARVRTEWHRLVFWDGLAENTAKYCGKGSLVAVGGKLRTRSWIDDNNVTRYVTEIHVEDVEFLSTKRPGSGGDADLIVEVGE